MAIETGKRSPQLVSTVYVGQRRLRRWLALFFLALAIPTLVLVAQAFRQLKWESFHRHSQQASGLAVQIDQSLADLLRREDQRPYSDYLFVSAAGTSNLLAQSPLAQFPLEPNVPGLIGYFQVDAEGQFSSPVLPEDISFAGFGIEAEELAQRRQLYRTIYELLADNALVERTSNTAEESDQLAGLGDRADLGKAVSREADGEEKQLESPLQDAAGRSASALSGTTQLSETSIATEPELRGQAVFDQLNVAPAETALKSERTRVAELTLDDRLQKLKRDVEADDARQQTDAPAGSPLVRSSPAARRKEQVYLPEGAVAYDANVIARSERIATFESELAPFEFSQLDSGHFVLFRNVWRDGQRLVQGALLDRETFLNDAIVEAFLASSLASMSDLVIGFQGDVLNAVSGSDRSSYVSSAEDLSGTLLHRRQLAAPLADMELIFTVNRLPTAAGAGLLGWTAAILALVLCGGVYGLYRLGLRQLTLGRQQQDFVSAVSHELKTPLTSIRMYSEMLREGWADADKQRGYYDYIHDESERLSRLIENVLQLARMTRNELDLNLQTTRVAQLVDLLRSKTESTLEQGGFSLQLECSDDVLKRSIEVDLDCFTQVFINLVDNALKFSGDDDRHQLDLAVVAVGRGIEFSLRDYGPGIPKSQLKKIFQLFYRPQSELTRETAGTGIGLALVHQLVLAMDGQIDVRNRQPGAEFLLQFPAV